MSGEATKKSETPQIVKSDKGLRLAEQWVNKMTKVAEDEPMEAESEGRPARLGLGAKISRQPRPGPLRDPVERKLYANLEASKRKATKDNEESGVTSRDAADGHDDDEPESRTSAFAKKKVISAAVSLPMKRKQR